MQWRSRASGRRGFEGADLAHLTRSDDHKAVVKLRSRSETVHRDFRRAVLGGIRCGGESNRSGEAKICCHLGDQIDGHSFIDARPQSRASAIGITRSHSEKGDRDGDGKRRTLGGSEAVDITVGNDVWTYRSECWIEGISRNARAAESPTRRGGGGCGEEIHGSGVRYNRQPGSGGGIVGGLERIANHPHAVGENYRVVFQPGVIALERASCIEILAASTDEIVVVADEQEVVIWRGWIFHRNQAESFPLLADGVDVAGGGVQVEAEFSDLRKVEI